MFKRFLLSLFMSITVAHAEPIIWGQNGVPLALDLPPFVALEKGMFAKRNLELEEPVNLASPSLVLTTLSSGQIKFTNFAMQGITQAHYNIPVVAIGRPVSLAVASLYVTDDIKTIKDIKGKTIAISGQHDATYFYIETILQNGGLTSNDVDYFFSPDSGTRLLALNSKRVSGALMLPPFNFLAENGGNKNLKLLTDIKPVIHKSLAFNLDWAKQNPEKVKALIESINESIEWLYDPKNRMEAIQLLAKISKISIEDATKGFDWVIEKNTFVRDPAVSRTAINNYVEASKTWGTINKDRVVPVENIVAPGATIKD